MELKAENVKNIRILSLCKEFLRQAIELNDQLNEELRHQKYKRCLSMAEWCDTEVGIADTSGNYEDMMWYTKWYERWMELSEKFKEAESGNSEREN